MLLQGMPCISLVPASTCRQVVSWRSSSFSSTSCEVGAWFVGIMRVMECSYHSACQQAPTPTCTSKCRTCASSPSFSSTFSAHISSSSIIKWVLMLLIGACRWLTNTQQGGTKLDARNVSIITRRPIQCAPHNPISYWYNSVVAWCWPVDHFWRNVRLVSKILHQFSTTSLLDGRIRPNKGLDLIRPFMARLPPH